MTRPVAVLMLTLGLPALVFAQASALSSPQPTNTPTRPEARVTPVPRALIGRWTAPVDRVPLSETSGWGRNTTAVRRANLLVRADGTGSLTVTRSVLNAAGSLLPGSRAIEQVDFTLGPEERPLGLRAYYATTVTRAVRRYPEPPASESAIVNVQISLYPPTDGQANTLEIDFAPFDGDGSFTATLRRQPSPAGAGNPSS